MKKAIYLLLVSMLFVTACTEQAPRIAKYTDLYAVKGTDSLFLDRYTAVSVEQDDARPCLVFVFGGGFIAGERDAERYLPFFHYMVNQGYDEWLKLKDVYITERLAPEFMLDKELLKNTLHEFRKTKHFSDILNRAVQFAYDEMI